MPIASRSASSTPPTAAADRGFVHEQVSKGSVIRMRGPRNHFPLVASPRYVFIAGGIGVTPMLPMIAEAEAAGAEWTLLYGGRSEESMAFVDELRAYGDRVTLLPGNDVALMSAALDARIGTPQPDTLVYTCGPEGLLGAVEQRCASWPSGSLHLERFAAKAVEGAVDAEFEVELARTGITITVPAESLHLRRGPGPRRQRPRLLPRGHLRDLRDGDHRRRRGGRPSRLRPQRRREGQ